MPEDAADLARADRRIVEGEMRYTGQLVAIERLRAAGHCDPPYSARPRAEITKSRSKYRGAV